MRHAVANSAAAVREARRVLVFGLGRTELRDADDPSPDGAVDGVAQPERGAHPDRHEHQGDEQQLAPAGHRGFLGDHRQQSAGVDRLADGAHRLDHVVDVHVDLRPLGIAAAAAGLCAGPLGHLLDRFGARRVFSAAIIVFTLGSIACGLSQSLWMLVVARIVQELVTRGFSHDDIVILTCHGIQNSVFSIHHVSDVVDGVADPPCTSGTYSSHVTGLPLNVKP